MRGRATLLGLAALMTVACGRPSERAYYTLRYPAVAPRFEQPLPVTIRVKEVDVRESYRRTEIVFRPDLHEIRYHKGRRWSEPTDKMLTTLIVDHLRGSGAVQRVIDSIGQTPPDYTLVSEVVALEQLQAGETHAARLAMQFRLVRFSDDTVVWSYDFDVRRPVGEGLLRATVRTLSEIMQVEFDKAIDSLARHLSGGGAPAEVEPAPKSGEPAADEGDGVIRPSATSPLNDLEQVMADTTNLPIGFGAVFLPALRDGDREPQVAVYAGNQPVTEGTMGKRIVLKPGRYTMRLGSGTVGQQIPFEVEVEEGRTTIVPPTWSALELDVVDEQFVPFRGTYELIRVDNREEYGIGFGADEQQGEEVRVWVLEPGLYKIIRAGGTYRDRSDFATVRLEPGQVTHFVLVLDPDTGEFQGAGEVDPAETRAAEQSDWQLRGVVGGAVSFNRTNQVGQEEGWELGLTVFYDGSIRYQHDRHQWTTRIDLEEEHARPSDGDFENVTDRLYLHTIYTYAVVPWFGPYVRSGFETKLFPRHQNFEDPTTVDELDEDGDVVETFQEVDRIEIAGPFSPMIIVESGGGNFRLLRTRSVELDLRVGFGARHTISNGLLAYEDVGGANDRLTPVESNHILGPEATVVGLGRVSRFVTLSTEFDGLLPISDDEAVFTWRNQISLRLASFASLNYRFNAVRDPNIGVDDDIRTEHDVQLRFSYTLF